MVKIRAGFVSNSSSSSFVISLSALTDDQVVAILHHMEYGKEHFPVELHFAPPDDGRVWRPCEDEDPEACGMWETGGEDEEADDYDCAHGVRFHFDSDDNGDQWNVVVDSREHELIGHTNMANFEMDSFLELIGVPSDAVAWGRGESDKEYWEERSARSGEERSAR